MSRDIALFLRPARENPPMRLLVATLVLTTALATPSVAATIYVNNAAGNDRYDGQSEQQSGERLGPVRTIQRALRLATASDRIVLANTGVPYRESITLFGRRNSGLEDFPFIINGNGAILEGADPVRPYVLPETARSMRELAGEHRQRLAWERANR